MANTLEFNVTVNTKGVAGGLKPVQTKLEQLRKTAEETRDAIVALGSTTDQSALSKLSAAASAYSSLATSLKKIADVKPQSITAAKNSLLKLVEPAQRLSEASEGLTGFAASLQYLASTMSQLEKFEPAVGVIEEAQKASNRAAKKPPLIQALEGIQKVANSTLSTNLSSVATSINSITTSVNGLSGVSRKLIDLGRGLEKLPTALNGFTQRNGRNIVARDFTTEITSLTKALAQMSAFISTTGKKPVLNPEMANSIYKLGEGLKSLNRLKIDDSLGAKLESVGGAIHRFTQGFNEGDTTHLQELTKSFSSLLNGLSKISGVTTKDTTTGITAALTAMKVVSDSADGINTEAIKTVSSAIRVLTRTISTVGGISEKDTTGGITATLTSVKLLARTAQEFPVDTLKTFSSVISTVVRSIGRLSNISNSGTLQGVTAVVGSIKRISQAANSAQVNNLASFSSAISSLSRAVVRMTSAFTGAAGSASNVANTLTSVKRIAELSTESEKLTTLSSALATVSRAISRMSAVFSAENGKGISAGVTIAINSIKQLSNATGAINYDGLSQFSAAISAMSSAFRSVAKSTDQVSNGDIEGGIGRVIGSLRALTDSSSVDLEGLKAVTSAISSVMRQINSISRLGENSEAVAAGLRVATSAMQELINTVSAFPEAEVAKVRVLADALDTVRRSGLKSAEAIRRVTKATNDTAKAASTAKGPLRKLGDQFMRILRYRVLRSVLMGIWQAMKEGVTNLYQYSVAIGNIDTNQAQSSMDKLSTSVLLVKNSLGSILTPIITAMVPVVQSIAHAFNQAANAIAAFFSALSGKSTFTGAIDLEKKFATAANSGGKALERQLLAFDEINRLDDNKGGGSSKEQLDYSKMFDEFEVPEGVKKFAATVKEIGETLSPVVTAVKDFGVELGKWFVDEGLPQIATDLEVIVNNVLFKKGTATDSEIEQSIRNVLAMIAGAVIGFSLLGLPGALLGATLGLKLSMKVNESLFEKGGATLESMKTSLRDTSAAITGAVIGWKVGGLKGALLGAAVGLSLSLMLDHAVFAKGGAVSATLSSTLPVILNMISGAAIGWKLGSLAGPTGAVVGALLGATVGAAITLGIESAMFKKGNGTTNEWVEMLKSSFETAFFAITGGIIGGAFGPGGVIFGIIIGAIIDLAIQKVRMKTDANTIFEDEIKIPDYKDKYDIELTPEELRKGGKVYGPGGVFGSYASGGFPDAGSAFIAGEAGPEFVGNIGGRTGVVNTSEMADAVAAGNVEVVGAIVAMANAVTRAIENKDTDITLDGQSVARAIYPYTKDVTRISGSSFVKNGGLA